MLLGLLSDDRYTKERHPPTGQWTLPGRHVLIGVDTRRDSGPHRGKRSVWGGRATVRSTLYMGALVASRRNPVLREFYQRLLEAGKLKKVALTACMRKLLTILNSMVRTGQKWDPIIPTS